MDLDKTMQHIEENYNDLKELPYEYRHYFVEGLIDSIYNAGKDPSKAILSRLSDLLLHDYVEGDTRSNKMRVEEYPIMSDAQYNRRVKGDNQAKGSKPYAYVEAILDDITILDGGIRPLELHVLDTLDEIE